jgi:hypothetical protein
MKRRPTFDTRAILLALVTGLLADGCVLERSGLIEQTCSSKVDCDDGTPCTDDVCNAEGLCEHAPVDATQALIQEPFDCKTKLCENGRAVVVNDDSDKPTNNPCIDATCSEGVLSEVPKPEGAQCRLGDGNGYCEGGECLVSCDPVNPDDPICDDFEVCTTDHCDAIIAKCLHDDFDNVPAKDADPTYADDAPGDCRVDLCLSGVLQVDQVDDADIPIDACACTTDYCENGFEVYDPFPASTPCPGSPELVCDGVCNCVGCVSEQDCPTPGNQCMDPLCDANQTCVEIPKSNGTGCNDGTLCSQSDTCQGGNCVGNNPVICPTPDQCHDPGVCDGGSGQCSNPPKGNGTGCNDNLFCTASDTCQNGACLGSGNPCPGPDNDGNCSETCNEGADQCNAPDPNGSACNDGAFCNGSDTCSGGACSGHAGNPCPGADGDGNCSESCNEGADQCNAPDPDTSACNDNLYCNGTDSCSGGACSTHSGNPCPGPDNDNNCAETCNEQQNNCTGYDGDGAACDTGPGNQACDDASTGCNVGQTCPAAQCI